MSYHHHNADDTYSPDLIPTSTPYFCENCQKQQPHMKEAFSIIYCKICGIENRTASEEELTENDNPQDGIRLQMELTKIKLIQKNGLLNYLSGISVPNTNFNVVKEPKHDQEVEGEIFKLFNKLKKYQRSLDTKEQKQIVVQKELFAEILDMLSYDVSLKVGTIGIWRKTLGFRIRFKSVVANIIASYMIASKLVKKPLSFVDVAKELDDGNFTRYSLLNDIWDAYTIIHGRLFGKKPCNEIPEIEKLKEEILDGTKLSVKNWIRCPRERFFIPLPDTTKDNVENIISVLDQMKKLKSPATIILQDADKIFQDAQSKALLTGKNTKTSSSAIAYLAIRKNVENFVLIDILKISGASDNRVRAAYKSINSTLKLGIKL